MVFLTSPNNPDGSLTSTADVEEILKLPVLVVSYFSSAMAQASPVTSHSQASVPCMQKRRSKRTSDVIHLMTCGNCLHSTRNSQGVPDLQLPLQCCSFCLVR